MSVTLDRPPPFVSYASNREDVILKRLFPGNAGFYVDVGASDPAIDSNTWAFYDSGWRGIVIEPLPDVFAKCQTRRPRDICLNVAVGDAEGEVTFFQFGAGAGHSTTVRARAEELQRDLGQPFTEFNVPVRTLGGIFEQHAKGIDIDFVSIDAEGAEADILRGARLSEFRPKVILIESIAPYRQVDVSQEACAILAAHEYVLGYEDGVNKFFVAKEHAALRDLLRYPPNAFDNYIGHSEWGVRRKLDKKKKSLRIARMGWALTAIVALVALTLQWTHHGG